MSSKIADNEQSQIKPMREKYVVFIPAAVTMLCLAPFINKAFHIDDPLFIWTAKHILKDPANFYNFPVNWYQSIMPMYEVTQNPPLSCYYIALVGGLIGWGERALHIAYLLPAAAAAAGMYYLARRLCRHPVTATLAAIFTPVFLVSSSNVMCDTMMAAFWIWAIVLWLKGIKENKALFLTLSAFLMGICALTKYFGMSLIGLLLVYTWVEKRKPGWWVVVLLLIPGAMLAGYQWYTHKLYNIGMLSRAVVYTNYHLGQRLSDLLPKGLTGLAFTGGCAITALFYSPWLWSKRILIVGVLLTVVLAFVLPYTVRLESFSFMDEAKGIKWTLVGQMALMVTAGVGVLALAIRDFGKSRDADSIMLMLWVLGTFVFASFINWSVNARSVYPMIPAAGILIVRQWERREKAGAKTGLLRRGLPLAGAAAAALVVCQADYVWANSARKAVDDIDKKYKGQAQHVFFQGHWGFQYYMEEKGYRALAINDERARKHDLMIIPAIIIPADFDMAKNPPSAIFKVKTFPYAAMMGPQLGAGFYASGPLPYAFGKVEADYYYAYEIP